jgi:putative transposase
LRDRGLPTDRQYLFMIDCAKALHTAIEELFGREQEVQRCRNHKIENAMNELPKEQQDQTRRLMPAAFQLSSAEEGQKRLEQIARQLEYDYASAERSLREGMKEMFPCNG